MSAELQQGLCDLCLLLYTQLSNLKPEESPTLADLLAYSPFECLDYLRQKILKLLKYRLESDQLPASHDLSTLHKFEKALQKAENDARNHIKVEQQLQLHIESLQSKFDEELKAKEDTMGHFKQIIDQLKSEKGGRERRYAVMDIGEMRGLEGGWTDRREESREIQLFSKASKEDSERIQELVRRIVKLEHQVRKYKAAYYARDQAYRDISQKLAALRSSKHPDFKPRRMLKKDQTIFDRSSSREAYTRAFTPIPTSLTATKAPLTHSNSTKRTRPKSRLKQHEADTCRD